VFIEIEDLKPEPLHVHHTYAVGELPFEYQGTELNEPVSTEFLLTHKEKNLRIGGTLQTGLRYTCSRCLKQAERHLATSFDLFYMPHPADVHTGEEIELKDADMDVGFYDGMRFDVDGMIVEQIMLSIPMRYVCSEECKGLCFSCGADLNEGPCPCKQDEPATRFAVLKEFRKRMDEK
jgi:uncharacterized protein